MTNSAHLPEYRKPPVIEVVCGIQFDPLKSLTSVSFGLFWDRMREEFPNHTDAPPLSPVFEPPGQDDSRQPKRVELLELPPLRRVLLASESQDWLLQVQQDRFLQNWRRTDGPEGYPRYTTILPKFMKSFGEFSSFCADTGSGAIQVNQLELTYINHIPAGDGWMSLAELDKVFRVFPQREGRKFLPAPQSLMWKTSFELPDRQGRLHVAIRHALRLSDKHPVLLCELTARGRPLQTNTLSIEKWFGVGHEWIVEGFADLATEEIQEKVWGRL